MPRGLTSTSSVESPRGGSLGTEFKAAGPFSLFDVCPYLRVVIEHALQIVDNRPSKGIARIFVDIIVDPETVFASHDKAGIFQYLQMLGRGGLGCAKDRLHLTYTHRPLLQHFEDAHPGLVAQCLCYLQKFSHCFYIS